MAKGGFDGLIDNIKSRNKDDPAGMTPKTKEIKENNPTQKSGGGFDNIIDNIQRRDKDDPTGTKTKSKEKPEVTKKKKTAGFDGIIDSIQDRDNDDPIGTKKATKKGTEITDGKEDKSDKSPLGDVAQAVGDIVGVGTQATIGIGLIKGINGLIKEKK